jgi:glycosyltransferase involved in cell wall biosynthesis
MACRCTVVTTDVFGASDVIDDSVSGYIVSVGDIDAFAERISRLTPDTLSRLREAARRRAAEFSWGKIAERVEALYREAVRAHRASSAS